MASEEDRERHSKRRKRNRVAKILRDPGEMRGAFSMKVINPKKTEYKRERLSVNKIEDDYEI